MFGTQRGHGETGGTRSGDVEDREGDGPRVRAGSRVCLTQPRDGFREVLWSHPQVQVNVSLGEHARQAGATGEHELAVHAEGLQSGGNGVMRLPGLINQIVRPLQPVHEEKQTTHREEPRAAVVEPLVERVAFKSLRRCVRCLSVAAWRRPAARQ